MDKSPDTRRKPLFTPLFVPHSPEAVAAWQVVGDPVMGGVSRGAVRWETGTGMVFEGEVSTDFGGGFASIELPVGMGACAGSHGLELEVEGQGHAWRIRVKEADMRPGEAWRAPFQTENGRRTRIHVPFSEFVRTIRGRQLEDQGTLQPARIDRIGLLIADGHTGPFRLTVYAIAAR